MMTQICKIIACFDKMAVVEDHAQFVEIDNDELEIIKAGLVPKNPKKSEKKCERCLMVYLK